MSGLTLNVYLLQHRDTPINNPDIKFEFSQENIDVSYYRNGSIISIKI